MSVRVVLDTNTVMALGWWQDPKLDSLARDLDAGAGTPDAWLTHAEKRDGSWWPEWHDWLTTGQHAQERVPAPEIGTVLPAVEPAPGSFVRG